jgi:hypothetical protein
MTPGQVPNGPREFPIAEFAGQVHHAEQLLGMSSQRGWRMLERELEHRHRLAERAQWLRFAVTMVLLLAGLAARCQ